MARCGEDCGFVLFACKTKKEHPLQIKTLLPYTYNRIFKVTD